MMSSRTPVDRDHHARQARERAQLQLRIDQIGTGFRSTSDGELLLLTPARNMVIGEATHGRF